jgi:hypothetical protein
VRIYCLLSSSHSNYLAPYIRYEYMRHTSSTLRLSIWRIRFSEENDLRSVPNPGAMVLMLYRIRLMSGTLKGVIFVNAGLIKIIFEEKEKERRIRIIYNFRMKHIMSPRAPCNDCLSYIIVFSSPHTSRSSERHTASFSILSELHPHHLRLSLHNKL